MTAAAISVYHTVYQSFISEETVGGERRGEDARCRDQESNCVIRPTAIAGSAFVFHAREKTPAPRRDAALLLSHKLVKMKPLVVQLVDKNRYACQQTALVFRLCSRELTMSQYPNFKPCHYQKNNQYLFQ